MTATPLSSPAEPSKGLKILNSLEMEKDKEEDYFISLSLSLNIYIYISNELVGKHLNGIYGLYVSNISHGRSLFLGYLPALLNIVLLIYYIT